MPLRYLRATCKRDHNEEGMGSSLTFWRASAAHAIIHGLLLCCSDTPMIVGHGLGVRAHAWLGLGTGMPTTLEVATLDQVFVHEEVDYSRSPGDAELVASAAGAPFPGGLAAAVRDHPQDGVVFIMRGCPRLFRPLANGISERVEANLRARYASAFSSRRVEPPWGPAASSAEFHVAVHYRAGDLFDQTRPGAVSAYAAGALDISEEAEGAHHQYPFDTWAGGRVLTLKYVRRSIESIAAVLPADVSAVFWVYSEGRREWFEPLIAALPHHKLQLVLTPPASEGTDPDPVDALRHLDALAHAHVLLLGGGAYSELAASLAASDLRSPPSIKLAPTDVWRGMPYAVPGAATISYPEGSLSDAAAHKIRDLAAAVASRPRSNPDSADL